MENLTLYTNGAYAALNPGWHIQDSVWKAKHILSAIQVAAAKPDTVAEIGCGPGAILAELSHQMDAEYFGFDPSSDAISQGLPNDHVTLKTGGVEDMGSYDLVLCIDVIEHVEDVFGFLRSLLRKGKVFIFHIPLDMNCYGVLRNVVMVNRKAMGHIHYFDLQTALSTLTECGFQVKDWFYTDSNELGNSPSRNFIKRAVFKVNPDFAALTLCGFSLMVTALNPDST